MRRMNPAELARQSHLTRQAISKWITSGHSWVNVESSSLQKIAQTLQLEPAFFLKNPYPDVSIDTLQKWTTSLLWDHLYDSLESYIAALRRRDPRAIGRYIQVFGLLNAEKAFGKTVISRFDKYARFIHPAKRKELETLCKTLQSLRPSLP